jgi:hypothetical protein
MVPVPTDGRRRALLVFRNISVEPCRTVHRCRCSIRYRAEIGWRSAGKAFERTPRVDEWGGISMLLQLAFPGASGNGGVRHSSE